MQVAGGGSMKLRSSDADWLQHVTAWWSVLLPKLAPFMVHAGGPILMVQVSGNVQEACEDRYGSHSCLPVSDAGQVHSLAGLQAVNLMGLWCLCACMPVSCVHR